MLSIYDTCNLLVFWDANKYYLIVGPSAGVMSAPLPQKDSRSFFKPPHHPPIFSKSYIFCHLLSLMYTNS